MGWRMRRSGGGRNEGAIGRAILEMIDEPCSDFSSSIRSAFWTVSPGTLLRKRIDGIRLDPRPPDRITRYDTPKELRSSQS